MSNVEIVVDNLVPKKKICSTIPVSTFFLGIIECYSKEEQLFYIPPPGGKVICFKTGTYMNTLQNDVINYREVNVKIVAIP